MSKNEVRFFTEGYTDELLLETLEVPPKYISRTGSVSQLEKAMKKQLRYFHKIIIGIVDFDKGKSLKFFNEFENCNNPDNILLKKKPDSNQYVLFLKPKAIERWILDASKNVEIKPENYNLSSDVKIFGNQTKNMNASKNKNLIKFIKDIKKAGAEPFVFLQEILHNLLYNKEYLCKTN